MSANYHVVFASVRSRHAVAYAATVPNSWVWVTGSGEWQVRVPAESTKNS